jgi:hypothetical protein
LNWLDKELEGLLGKEAIEVANMVIKLVKPQRDHQEAERRIYYGGPRFIRADQEESSEEESETASEELEHAVEVQLEEMKLSDTTRLMHKGTSMKLIDLVLGQISFVFLGSLCISVECNRCKHQSIINNIKPNPDDSLDWTSLACEKCKCTLAVNFRPDTLHAQNNQIGFLDLVECSIVDILNNSKYLATCLDCGTTQALNACFKSFTDHKGGMNCRECHKLLVFSASQIVFKSSGVEKVLSEAVMKKIKVKKTLKKREKREGLSVGEPLPKRGACFHYKKSYRWFRFPCCGRLFACDECHSEQTRDSPHEIQWANRMVCGFCSREQPYSQKPCICGRDLTGNTTSGFWEGGAGTRDRAKMNKNDPKKYKGDYKTMSNRAKDKKYGRKAENL